LDGLPFSQAADNNREAILTALQVLLSGARSVLEIGAGTGQHAAYFASEMPELHWIPTEHPLAHSTLKPRCEQASLANLGAPRILDICDHPWNIDWPDAVYTANTLHIIARSAVESLFAACAEGAPSGSLLLVYGPFNYAGSYTSASNARFDEWLKARDPASAIRDFEWVNALARDAGFALREDTTMPANNRLLCWQKK
jgi:cyclopropane fatty-acyl-phospholipid synthase-like methyltransferase